MRPRARPSGSRSCARSGDKEAARLVALLERIVAALNEGRSVRSLALDEDDNALVRQYCFITAKPTMYVANVLDSGFDNNPKLRAVQDYAQAENAPVVAVCAPIEAEIADRDDDDKSDFLEDEGHDPKSVV